MSDSPPPSPEPPLALWKRITNWANLKSPMGVPVEELRPDSGYTRLILAAVYDIRLCEVMFDGWMTQLDRITINSNTPNKREQLLGFYLGLLKEGACECSKSTNAILRCHVQFANLMAQRMDDASKSQLRALNRDELGTTTLADDINKASQELLLYVTRMKDNLSTFVSNLEKIEITVGKGQTFTVAEWIWGWIKSFFIVIAWTFALGFFFTRTAPADSADSTLRRDGVEFRGAARALEGKESESTKSVLPFLKEIVPKEAQIAQKRLDMFDGALVAMGLEDRMKTRRGASQHGRDPASIAKEWLDVAKLYQSVLPDDNDPARILPTSPAESPCS